MKIPFVSDRIQARSWRWKRELRNGEWLGPVNRYDAKYAAFLNLVVAVSIITSCVLLLCDIITLLVIGVIGVLCIAILIVQCIIIEKYAHIPYIPGWRK